MLAVDWSQGIQDAWSEVASFVPKFLAFLAIVIIGYVVARVLGQLTDRLLERVGFDRAVERGGVKRALDRSGIDASGLVGKLVFYAVMLLVLQMAFGVFGPNAVSDLIAGIVAYLPKVIAAVLIVVITTAIGVVAKDLITAALGNLSYGRTLGTAAMVAIVGFGVFAALNQLQIAPEIVNGLFYAVVATVAGSLIIAVGGGGIGPMRQRWERALARYDEEAPRVRREMEVAKQRRAEDRRAGAQGAHVAGQAEPTVVGRDDLVTREELAARSRPDDTLY